MGVKKELEVEKKEKGRVEVEQELARPKLYIYMIVYPTGLCSPCKESW